MVTEVYVHVHVYMCVCVQDHDSRVAETAVVGFPHDVFGEGTVQYIHVCIHIHVYIHEHVYTCTMYMYMGKLGCVGRVG